MKGFTLVEILIIVAISAMLSAIAISYTGIARNATALSIETSKIAGFIFRAKDLAITTYNLPGVSAKVCGYGVLFKIGALTSTYSVFAYYPTPAKYPGIIDPTRFCPSFASTTAGRVSPVEMVQSSQGAWNVPLANGVRMQSGGSSDALMVVLFIPPDPRTLLSHDGNIFMTSTLKVYLTTSDNRASTTISVNGAGQVSF